MYIDELEALGDYCDTNSLCDPYVIIFIDNQKVYETKKMVDTESADFMETYTSHRIKADAKIKVEVWDEDNFTNGDDDLLWRDEREISYFVDRNSWFWKNFFIRIKTTWKTEYTV